MSRPEPKVTLEVDGFAAHGRALRRLALALVRDEDLAEDLVQDTWIASLRSPPDPRRPLRPWLLEILRNLVRGGYRANRRRQRREQAFAASSPPSAAPPDELMASAELQGLLVELLRALEEPFRSAVILRYVEGQTAVEIARAQGIPAATVRSRARHGLERIRADLDRRHGGDRRTWRYALLPFTGVAPAATASTIKVMTGVLPLGLAVAFAVLTPLQREPPNRTIGSDAASAGRPVGGLLLNRANRGTAPASIQGVVRSPAGEIVAGARVVLVPNDGLLSGDGVRVAESRADGFHLNNLQAGSYTLSATEPGFVTARRVIFMRPGTDARGMDLTLSPGGLVLSGRVLDSSRLPLAGAVVEAIGNGRCHAVTDGTGAFTLSLAKGSYRLSAAAAGFASESHPVLLGSDASTEFLLEPGAQVQGRVVIRGSAKPLADVALVLLDRQKGFFDSRRARSDRDGRFEFRDLPAGNYQLFARQEARTGTVAGMQLAAAARTSRLVELEAGSTVAGQITGDGGRPVPNAYVALGQKQVAGIWIDGRTGPDGRYRLSGVLPGTWWLVARAPGYLAEVHRDLEVEPGTGARQDLALARGAAIQGKVIDEAGQPLADARVTVVDHGRPLRDNGAIAAAEEKRYRVASGADGSFRIDQLPRGPLRLTTAHPAFATRQLGPIAPGAPGLRVDLRP